VYERRHRVGEGLLGRLEGLRSVTGLSSLLLSRFTSHYNAQFSKS